MVSHSKFSYGPQRHVSNVRQCRAPFAGVFFAALAVILVFAQPGLGAARVDPGAIVAIVNDEPISEFDVNQRTKMLIAMRALPPKRSEKVRKQVMDQLINEMLQRQEAKRLKVKVKDADLDAAIKRIASRFGPDVSNLTKLLKKKGIELQTLKGQVDATIAWQRIVRSRFRVLLKVTDAQVNKRFEQQKSNPRPSRVFYLLKRVILPIPKRTSAAMMESRIIEARRIQRKFKGCARIRRATADTFDVRIVNMKPVPAEALPAPFRKQLNRMGPGRMSGPGRGRGGGIEMIAYCSKKVVRAPEPTRKAIENQIVGEQVNLMAGRYLRDLRRDATIEIR